MGLRKKIAENLAIPLFIKTNAKPSSWEKVAPNVDYFCNKKLPNINNHPKCLKIPQSGQRAIFKRGKET
jgi:hypothetical protein